MMRVIDVANRVERISAASNDDEVAHTLEDEMFVDVLVAIRDGECVSPAALAREALKSLNIKFGRWVA